MRAQARYNTDIRAEAEARQMNILASVAMTAAVLLMSAADSLGELFATWLGF